MYVVVKVVGLHITRHYTNHKVYFASTVANNVFVVWRTRLLFFRSLSLYLSNLSFELPICDVRMWTMTLFDICLYGVMNFIYEECSTRPFLHNYSQNRQFCSHCFVVHRHCLCLNTFTLQTYIGHVSPFKKRFPMKLIATHSPCTRLDIKQNGQYVCV